VVRFELLGTGHDRNGFDCGVEPLNRYLRQFAKQHIDRDISRTFVAVEGESVPVQSVLGFFTVSLCQVDRDEVPDEWARRLPNEIPAMKLGRLAVALNRRGTGLGFALLTEALYRVTLVNELAGGTGVVVDAKDASAAAFYRKFGFTPSRIDPLTLFMPAGTARSFARGE
jgi:GNAT superfamily N-acetyltransferase